ncbi:hypothetical protein J4Q44_G00032830 [Coregonus suidteri]|uniref:PAW domain-containing protein n=1 Tax=Coregonus suidteri TaxID=861788 RepID=A0AAN8MIF7_9TELE
MNGPKFASQLKRVGTGPGTAPLAAAAEFVFVPTEKVKSGRVFNLRYNSTKDHYCRVSNDNEDIQGWHKTVWRKESVFRKLENDWQMLVMEAELAGGGESSWQHSQMFRRTLNERKESSSEILVKMEEDDA